MLHRWRYLERAMLRLRGAIGPIAGVWLFYQMATIALVPAAVKAGSVGERQAECACPHRSAGGACPMHKKDASSTPCLLRGPNDSRAALGSLFAPVGLLSAPRTPTLPVFIGTMSLVELSSVTDRALPPDPPPPRS